MAYDAKTERLISLKKLAGKAQTSNDKGLANEGLPSGLTLASNTVFGEAITTSPVSTSLYTITGKVEYLRFPTSFIAGSDTSDGRHGFELKLPTDYESNSSNSGRGTYPFINNQVINITSGNLQLIPPSFATAYEAKPYYGGTSAKDSGTQIPLLDARDWYLDYFNGVFFQQDPPGSGDHSNNPDFVEGFLYIGNMLDTVVSNAGSGGSGDPAAQYLVLAATGSLSAERVLTVSTGLSSSDAGAGGAFTLTIDNSVVSTLTGSQFSGNVGITGSLGVTQGLSGSLTKLVDGTSYMIAGDNITITSGAAGAITITSTGGGGSGPGDPAAQYLVLAATASLSAERVFTTGSGLQAVDSGAGSTFLLDTNPLMTIYEVTASHAASQPLLLPSTNFSRNSYNFHKNQVFLNGVLMASGSGLDYTLNSPATGSITFNLQLKDEDVVTVRQS